MEEFFTDHFLQLNPIWQMLIWLVLWSLIGYVFSFLLLKGITHRYSRSNSYISNSISRHLGGRVRSFFPLLFFYLSMGSLALGEDLAYIIAAILRVLIVVNLGWLCLRLLNVLEDTFFEQYKIRKNKYLKERRIRTQIQFLKRFTAILVFILGTAAILLSFEEVQKIGQTILTSTAIIGVIVGFASQKTIGNLISGFQIAFTQPIKIDDTVIVEKEWGVIEEITLTYVVVQIWDKRRLIVPINYFITTPFQNWTRHSEDLFGEVKVHVDYRLPLGPVREELKRIVEGHDLWDGKICHLQVTEATDKTMVIRATVSSEDSYKSWDLKCDIREHLIAFIQEHYPQYLPQTRATIEEKSDTSPDQA